jgi:hypothetical protein
MVLTRCDRYGFNLWRCGNPHGAEVATSNLRDKIPTPRRPRRSLARLKTAKADPLQMRNVRKLNQSLSSFREWKAEGVGGGGLSVSVRHFAECLLLAKSGHAFAGS